jgi:hypothetical protein
LDFLKEIDTKYAKYVATNLKQEENDFAQESVHMVQKELHRK